MEFHPQKCQTMHITNKRKPTTVPYTIHGHVLEEVDTAKYLGGLGAQWLSGRVLDSRPKGCGFEPHRRHCVVSLSKNINPSLVLVQPRKTRPFITERLLMGRKESNQTNKISGSAYTNNSTGTTISALSQRKPTTHVHSSSVTSASAQRRPRSYATEPL